MRSNNAAFLLVPNHSVVRDGDILGMESAEISMLRAVTKRFPRIGIAAFATAIKNSSLTGEIRTTETRLHVLSQMEHAKSALAQLINYFRAIVAIPFVVSKYDFIYVFAPGHCGLMTALWARLLGKKYGLYVRNTWLNSKNESSWWWKLVFGGARFMIVTGEAFRRRLLPYCNIVENEVPLTALRPGQVKPSFPERSTTSFLFVGRLYETKGVLDAIRALGVLQRRGILASLHIAGGGIESEYRTINALKAELSLDDRVHLHGHLSPDALGELYSRSTIFVFPSYYGEGFPRVLYEAMMYSVAIVTCGMPGIEGFLVDGRNCLYVSPRNPEQLADRLQLLLQNHSFRDSLSTNAKRDVVELYKSFIDESHPQQLLRLTERVGTVQP